MSQDERRPLRLLAVLLPLCVALSLGLGIARVLVQRAHPPEWALRNENTYEGYVTVDGYARVAERFRDWAAGDDAGGERLTRHLRESAHPSAVLVPALTAASSFVLGSIPLAFLGLSALAFVALIALAARLGARLVPDEPRAGSLLAAVLLAGHFLSARTAGALILDPFVALFACLAVLLALRFEEHRSAGAAAGLFATQLLGCFLKLSYLPFLAAPALIALFAGEGPRWRPAARAALLFGLLPALPLAAYLHLVPELSALAAESDMAVAGWTLTPAHIAEYLLELALLLQFLPVVLLSPSVWRSPRVRAVLAAAGPALLANLLIRPPINPRLYLAPLALLIVAATPALLARLPGRRLVVPLALYLVGNLALAAVGLVLATR